ncbi:MAG TPA: hypothetical protein VK420_05960, partial [Longimicrobium sp.]|nr:hypothetical protein [Longimicrobium sp.]
MRRRHWKNIAVVACVGFVGACWFAVRFYEAARRAPQATADQPTAVQGPALPGASAASRRTDREEALDPRA